MKYGKYVFASLPKKEGYFAFFHVLRHLRHYILSGGEFFLGNYCIFFLALA
jgi:hypothetical protein